MPAEYTSFLTCMTLFHAFSRIICLFCIVNLKRGSYFQMPSIKDRELIFAVLDRSFNCLCGSSKEKTQ